MTDGERHTIRCGLGSADYSQEKQQQQQQHVQQQQQQQQQKQQHITLTTAAATGVTVSTPGAATRLPQISARDLAYLVDVTPRDGSYQCSLCGKQFGYKNGLIRHVRLTHVGEKPYQCNICQRRFGYKHILMEHQNLHFGNRPYACTMCDKRFAARSNLIQHRTVHRRPFHCSQCGKRFDREEQLKKHEFAHPQTLLTCNTCHYTAVTQTDLNRHMLHAHRPHDIVGRGGVDAGYTTGAPRERTGSGVHQSEVTPPRSVNSVTPPGVGREQQQVEPGHHSQRIDAICNILGRTDETPSIGGVVIKQERADDSGDSGGYVMPQLLGHVVLQTSGTERTTASVDSQQPTGILPGIHEAFSHRSPLQQLSPTLAVPVAASPGFSQPVTDYGHQASVSRQPEIVASHSALFLSLPVAAQSLSPRRKPTAQLPPIAHVLRQSRDKATQHSAPIPDILNLDDVLSYYISQGSLFRCRHCNILFFERGMYFLHSSLHGAHSPWQCSICHTECLDKNEFTLHFVNQQHSA